MLNIQIYLRKYRQIAYYYDIGGKILNVKHRAILIGIGDYTDHTLAGVKNDLHLLARSLSHRNFPESAIKIYPNTHSTLGKLKKLLSQIRAEFDSIDQGIYYLHISASGALSADLSEAGVLPMDGHMLNFDSVLPYREFPRYLPIRSGIQTVVTLDV